jgi:hypothetical protein
MKTLSSHHWTKDDESLALYLYRFSEDGLGLSLRKIGDKLGIGVGPLKMRIGNFCYLDTGAGLSHPSSQSREIYRLDKATSQGDLKRLVLKILSK